MDLGLHLSVKFVSRGQLPSRLRIISRYVSDKHFFFTLKNDTTTISIRRTTTTLTKTTITTT